uniref:Cadherin domain-containing protein n=1 Tax=Callorhinchus milii TaxID=7868 RepID=A0A4W3JTN0_CALMI
MHRKRLWMVKWQVLPSFFSLVRILVGGQFNYSIPEELGNGSFVANIAADLGLDVATLSSLRLSAVSGSGKQYFSVDTETGILSVYGRLDREELCGPMHSCVVHLDAIAQNPLELYRVEVEILDVNDNPPIFPKRQVRLNILESALPGTRFPLEWAHDPDVGPNTVHIYQLNKHKHFALDVQTLADGNVFPELLLEKPLDRERVHVHQLLLTAIDGGTPARSGTVQIIIQILDVNDNVPVFDQSVYKVSLRENVPLGTMVTKLNATDLDEGSNGEVVYSYSSSTADKVRMTFNLDSKTGEIRVKANLDFEAAHFYELYVQAKDFPGSGPSQCKVLVTITDVNDNAPKVILTSVTTMVPEDALPGATVGLISVTDRDLGDNGQVWCQIAKNVPFKLFSTLQGYYKLMTDGPLDRELVSEYNITITAWDLGSPSLSANKTILVSDVNDNAPRFAQHSYTARVTENNVVGASIYSVTASDPDVNQNARLSYSILEKRVEGESVSSYVRINSETGVVAAQRSFDYEQLKSFQFHVQARDNGKPPLASNVSVDIIILDQNDNSPVIVSPLPEYGSTATETVSRLAEPGYLVARISAIDADTGQNGRLAYQILQATDPGLFTISPDTGEIWTIRRVVGKDPTQQRLVIGVKDNGSPSLSATMTIILSISGSDIEMLSHNSGLPDDLGFPSDINLYLVVCLAITSCIFLVVLIILAVKVHRNRNGLGNNYSLPSRNIQIPPNYVEVFGGDPLSQSFRYETCSTSGSVKRDFMFSSVRDPSHCRDNVTKEADAKEEYLQASNHRNIVNSEVRILSMSPCI